MKLQLEKKKPELEKKNSNSAYATSGINKPIYTNNFDSELLNSHAQEIIELSKKAQEYHDKKLAIKKNELRYKAYLEKGAITQTQYDAYIYRYLKGNDLFQVYETYDSYISSLATKMRSYTDAIFQYLEKHTFTIPLEEMEQENASQQKLQKNSIDEHAFANKTSLAKKETARKKAIDLSKWDAKADTFVKRKKKVSVTNQIAKFVSSIFTADVKKKKKKTFLKDDVSKQANLSTKMGNFFSLILGTQKSVFEKGRTSTTKKLDSFLKKYTTKNDVISKKTALSDKFKNLRRIKIEAKDKEEDTNALGLIGEQSHSNLGTDAISRQKNSQKSVAYSASSYSALANILMKNISLEFIDSFPNFFKKLYRTLRLANIKILSSSYTNMMLLSAITGSIAGFFIFGIFSFFALIPFFMVFANAFLGGILIGCGVILGYYMYPNYEAKRRDRDIKGNISFAIDHMAAIVSAGVSPNAMLALVSESNEYGEFSVEISKVVEYIELFGYDMITAINGVSSLTPSNTMKDFLEGFVSSIESGGDLKKFLREKADATMLQYKLERQRYTESVSTFSDIYTGIMVASPLFFVALLSLVSILGGTVGNMDINTLMILGTYVAIPLMNLLFMGFMEITQPNL